MSLCDLSRETFVQYLGGSYERFGWVVERSYNKGLTAAHDNPELLARVFQQSLQDASEVEKLELIRAYPDLLGKASIAGCLSRSASTEFANAGLFSSTPEQIECFRQLNRLYWARFGFPFVMAVQESSVDDILKVLSERVRNDRATEVQNALTQIHRIARLRIDRLLHDDSEERALDTPLAQPVNMDTDAYGDADAPSDRHSGMHAGMHSDAFSANDHVREPMKVGFPDLWNATDKSQEAKGILAWISASQLPGAKRAVASVSAFFTPATLLASVLSFGFGWMLSEL